MSFVKEIDLIEENNDSKNGLNCYHCGDICEDDSISKDDKYFCCTGCLFVHELLNDNNLNDFYELSKKTGLKPRKFEKSEFQYLDNKEISDKLLQYSINGTSKINLFIPEIYCSACIWLLENLFRLNKGILESKVNFLKKEVSITFKDHVTSLREIVELLTSIGYQPKLNISDIEGRKPQNINKPLYIKLGIAGFAFGNIMLLALPEYLSSGELEPYFKTFVGYLNLLLAFPVLYASTDYFTSALRSLRLKYINIDVPISLGIIALFLRSLYEIVFGVGAGYVDSMSGLIFFLLLGKVFRQKTFHSLSFDRDYKSYFPMSIIRKSRFGNIHSSEEDEFIPLKDIQTGDILQIRSNEIVPVDSILLSEAAMIDYSFVSGESKPLSIVKDAKIFAGGKQIGASIDVIAEKEFYQSYLTELWNHSAFKKESANQDESYISHLSNTIAKYFTFIVLGIAIGAFIYWIPTDFDLSMNAFTAVLIIACPCAIALTMPFTYGMTLRVLSMNNFFLKNDNIVEYLSKITTIVFDKTGTLTDINNSSVNYYGKELSPEEKILIKSAAKHSTHPASRLIFNYLRSIDTIDISIFNEVAGKGIESEYNGYIIKIGKYDWVNSILAEKDETIITDLNPTFKTESNVYISINNKIYGYFQIVPAYRNNISAALKNLITKYKISVISGDNDNEKSNLEEIAGQNIEMKFNQLPGQKLEYIEMKQANKEVVMMIGDGLNDAGALKQSNVGLAVADNTSSFTPGSDAIIIAENLSELPKYMIFSKKAMNTVSWSYLISFLYNIAGITLAVQGNLSPVIAALLMPISSISVIIFTVSKVKFDSKRLDLR